MRERLQPLRDGPVIARVNEVASGRGLPPSQISLAWLLHKGGDIVPIPTHVRENLDKQNVTMLAPNSVEMFPAETAQSMFDFRAEEVVGKIAPRPLLLIHAANDSVTPTEQSIEMFERAGQPAELHLFSGLDHFLFAENSTRVWSLLRNWLDTYFPVTK